MSLTVCSSPGAGMRVSESMRILSGSSRRTRLTGGAAVTSASASTSASVSASSAPSLNLGSLGSNDAGILIDVLVTRRCIVSKYRRASLAGCSDMRAERDAQSCAHSNMRFSAVVTSQICAFCRRTGRRFLSSVSAGGSAVLPYSTGHSSTSLSMSSAKTLVKSFAVRGRGTYAVTKSIKVSVAYAAALSGGGRVGGKLARSSSIRPRWCRPLYMPAMLAASPASCIATNACTGIGSSHTGVSGSGIVAHSAASSSGSGPCTATSSKKRGSGTLKSARPTSNTRLGSTRGLTKSKSAPCSTLMRVERLAMKTLVTSNAPSVADELAASGNWLASAAISSSRLRRSSLRDDGPTLSSRSWNASPGCLTGRRFTMLDRSSSCVRCTSSSSSARTRGSSIATDGSVTIVVVMADLVRRCSKRNTCLRTSPAASIESSRLDTVLRSTMPLPGASSDNRLATAIGANTISPPASRSISRMRWRRAWPALVAARKNCACALIASASSSSLSCSCERAALAATLSPG
eukprot:Unigene15082_Nuclearia_a/m.45167 Unigene15082_Nuclearia_a/g.45167  ORF Unigene15082_Nuclearia_a/g.45167 Unigene15082_Nuclearia_a/m.45167 type:complete len:520 (+) Unigene15082_Nuclearia_a:533-2092(+)